MIHKVIYSLYPNTSYINDESQAFDAQGNLIELNMVTVNAEVAKLKAAYDTKEYQRLRAREYPPMTDYLDGIAKGDQAQIDKYIADCQAVKTKYPKGVA